MRPLLPAAGLALMLHGLIFYFSPHWSPKIVPPRLRKEPLSLALSYRESPKKVISSPPRETASERRPPLAPPKKSTPPPPRKRRSQPPKPAKKPQKKMTMHPPRVLKTREIRRSPPPKPSPAPAKVPEPGPVASISPSLGNPGRGSSFHLRGPNAVLRQSPVRGAGRAESAAPAAPTLREAMPLYKENRPPRYPRIARRRGYQGVVQMEVLVDREGKAKEVRLLHSSGYPVLDKAALNAVRKWRFEPGKRGDEPVEMWVVVPVRFRLK
ncbi:MAG: energy transducer TonB [Deltaproteobacteria bacterium]|nr:energy transducer TonB [Deltaproteobacteria bacterium]MBW2016342.1 energy transducer TonB [Deltaproteobacteria bacterium]MBW2129610.1 energy transducer TonB [Deltaproteobacteria bacterium]MBW2304007.1 energy transducer TonB [Deltaproteobacteria bacterium]